MKLHDYKLTLAEKRKAYSKNFKNVFARAHWSIRQTLSVYIDKSSFSPHHILMGNGWQSNWFRNCYSKHTGHFACKLAGF